MAGDSAEPVQLAQFAATGTTVASRAPADAPEVADGKGSGLPAPRRPSATTESSVVIAPHDNDSGLSEGRDVMLRQASWAARLAGPASGPVVPPASVKARTASNPQVGKGVAELQAASESLDGISASLQRVRELAVGRGGSGGVLRLGGHPAEVSACTDPRTLASGSSAASTREGFERRGEWEKCVASGGIDGSERAAAFPSSLGPFAVRPLGDLPVVSKKTTGWLSASGGSWTMAHALSSLAPLLRYIKATLPEAGDDTGAGADMEATRTPSVERTCSENASAPGAEFGQEQADHSELCGIGLQTVTALAGATTPPTPLTLPDAPRRRLFIPVDARSYCWCYPPTNVADVPDDVLEHLDPTAPEVCWIVFGGFAYLNEDGECIAANAMAGFGGTMAFDGPFRYEEPTSRRPPGGWHRITLRTVQSSGARYFRWMNSGEKIAGYPKGIPDGGFCYLFRRPDEPPREDDCYFLLLKRGHGAGSRAWKKMGAEHQRKIQVSTQRKRTARMWSLMVSHLEDKDALMSIAKTGGNMQRSAQQFLKWWTDKEGFSPVDELLSNLVFPTNLSGGAGSTTHMDKLYQLSQTADEIKNCSAMSTRTVSGAANPLIVRAAEQRRRLGDDLRERSQTGAAAVGAADTGTRGPLGGSAPDCFLSPTALFCLALYTQNGPDTDEKLGFTDVPNIKERERYQKYVGQYQQKRLRNPKCGATLPGWATGAVFKVLNWAARTAFDDKKRAVLRERESAEHELRRWVKFLGVILASTVQLDSPSVHDSLIACKRRLVDMAQIEKLEKVLPIAAAAMADGNLWRGIYGVSDADLELLSRMPEGQAYGWGTPASATLDQRVARRFARVPSRRGSEEKPVLELDKAVSGQAGGVSPGDEANAVVFHITNIKYGIPLWPLSQYPEELELLIPPFTSFVVESPPTPPESIGHMKVLSIKLRCVRWCGELTEDYGTWCAKVRDGLRRDDARLTLHLSHASPISLLSFNSHEMHMRHTFHRFVHFNRARKRYRKAFTLFWRAGTDEDASREFFRKWRMHCVARLSEIRTESEVLQARVSALEKMLAEEQRLREDLARQQGKQPETRELAGV